MVSFALVLAVLVSPTVPQPAAAPPAPPRRGLEIHWREERYELDELPEELPEGAREAIAYFAPWAEEEDYVFELSDGAEFMMVTHERPFSSRDWAKAVAPALELIDELAPLPDRGEGGAETGTTEASADEGMSWTWGDVVELEHDTACFFRLKKPDHMQSLLAYVADKEDEPAGWADPLASLPGLLLYRPLAGIIVETAPGVEEWDPLNETVNRIARLMLARRFGKTPYWLEMGIAWKVEYEVRGSIFCFPHRATFVGVAEHGGWRDDLKRQFSKRSSPPMDMNRLVSWPPGTYDPIQAARAWGTVSYVVEADPGALGPILEDLRLLTDEKGRIDHADGTWELIPNFQPAPDDQLEVFRRHVGPDFLEDVTTYFYKGMKQPR